MCREVAVNPNALMALNVRPSVTEIENSAPELRDSYIVLYTLSYTIRAMPSSAVHR
jgi:hypothetical protein